MNEVAKQTPAPEAHQDLPGATQEAERSADAKAGQALKVLGEVAGGHPVVLATGEVRSQRDLDEERRLREEQGHSYQR